METHNVCVATISATNIEIPVRAAAAPAESLSPDLLDARQKN
jgi:hypothetical protein